MFTFKIIWSEILFLKKFIFQKRLRKNFQQLQGAFLVSSEGIFSEGMFLLDWPTIYSATVRRRLKSVI